MRYKYTPKEIDSRLRQMIVNSDKEMTQRTPQQQKAIEVFCHNVADALNDAGFDLKAVLKRKRIPVPCTQPNIKENVFKPIEKALFNKTSTTQLTTGEVTEVYDVMNKWLGEQFEIHVPFPSEEEE